jgi:hypothetical protein
MRKWHNNVVSARKHEKKKLNVIIIILIIMNNFIIFNLFIFLIFFINNLNAIIWISGKNENITREIKILKSPFQGNNHTFEAVAIQINKQDQFVDAIDFFFSTFWVPRYILKLFIKENGTSYFFNRWLLWKIIQYKENNSNLGFDPGKDIIVANYTMWNQHWSNLMFSQYVDNGNKVYSLCSQTGESSHIGTLSLCIHISNVQTLFKERYIHPNAVKWSINITNINSTAIQGTNVALKVSFDSDYLIRNLEDLDPELLNHIDEEALDLRVENKTNSSFLHKPIASWRTVLTILGQGCNGTGSVIRSQIYSSQSIYDFDILPNGDPDNLIFSQGEKIVYYSFIPGGINCIPSSIDWDPEFGISEQYSSEANKLYSFFYILLFYVYLFF